MSSSDDDYDPAEVTVAVPAPTPAAPSAADSVPLSRASIFATSPSTTTTTASAGTTTTTHAAAHVHPAGSSAGGSGGGRLAAGARSTAEGGYRLRSDMKGRVRCLAVNPAGTTLCAGSEDGQLCMWDFTVPLKSHRVAPTRVLTPFVNRISGLQPIIALAFAADGSYLVACQDGDSPALVRASGEQLGYCAMGERGLLDVVQCRGHRAPVTSVATHHTKAAVFLTGSQDGTARLWDHNTFKQRSVYAVKHGSGQVTDTHVVESVASLHGGHGDTFATGGQDGMVQLWDSRVKYRPGGAVAAVDLFAAAAAHHDPFGEKHVGGMLEVVHTSEAETEEGDGEASVPTASRAYALAVRVGSVVKHIDLRALSAKSSPSAGAVVEEVAADLPFVLDTTCLSAGSSLGSPSASSSSTRVLTCTSRRGYRGIFGGHVLQYDYRSSPPSLDCVLDWRAGEAEEDVLCVCADQSRADGCIYAGLSSGEVVVHGAFSGAVTPQPVEEWLDTRPVREGRGERVAGEKAPRQYDDADVLADLF